MTKPREKLSPENEPQLARDGPTREEIELRAYHLYLERGGASGQDVEDWLQAERELVEKYGKPSQKTKATAA